MTLRAGLGAVIILLSAEGVPARAASDCARVGGVSTDETSAWSKVRTDAKRVYFLHGPGEKAQCPSPSPACRKQSYVVGGDALLLGRAAGGYVCARFVGLHQSYDGWVRQAELDAAASTFFPTWWDGFWSSRDDYARRITIQYGDGASFKISAELNGIVLAGEFEPTGDRAEFAIGDDGRPKPLAGAGDTACVVTLRVAGPYLLVKSGEACGAAQFSGVYGH